jgi:hypothetical protein
VLINRYIFPLFNTPGDPSGGPVEAPAEAPVDTATLPDIAPADVPESINESESYALEAFEALQNDDGDEGSVEQEAPEAPTEVPAATPDTAPVEPARTPVVPAKPGDATPPGAAGAQQTAAQAGSVTPVRQEPVAPATPEAEPDPQTLAGLAQALESQREVFVKALAGQKYKFSQQDMERFNTEPDVFIAEVAARVQVQTTESLMRVMWQQLPKLINSTVQKQVADDRAENAFWSANPDLARDKHKQLVDTTGALFRKQFPQADEATFHKNVGAMVRGALGMVALAAQSQGGNGHGRPQPQVQTPGRVVRQITSHLPPAGVGSAPASSASRAPVGEWEAMMQLIQRDDNGEFG